MIRVLLAAEGESDEIVISAILNHRTTSLQIDRKVMPSRGIHVVLGLAPLITRAAYFGFHDVLVIHADADDTSATGPNSRKQSVGDIMAGTLERLPEIHRPRPLQPIACCPRQATDAWMIWARNGGDGRSWESMNRHEIKGFLYGSPPVEIRAKAEALSSQLIDRMEASDLWPDSLLAFVTEWEAAMHLTGQAAD